MKQLQKAVKSGNVGVILGEAAKRAKRTVGLRQSNSLSEVHPKLALQAQLTSKVGILRYLEATYLFKTNLFYDRLLKDLV